MSKENGFLKLRREVLEHVRNGKMTHLEFNVFVYITSQADTRSGVWNGSANALAGEWALSPRAARRQLEALEAKGYLKRFPIRGSHLCYPILVKRFLVTEGEHAGEFLNIGQSTNPMDLKYDKSGQNGEEWGEQRGEDRGALMSSQRRIENRETTTSCANPNDGSHDAVLFPEQKQGLDQVVRRTWAYYCEKLGKNPKLLSLTDKRKRKGAARLKEALQKTGCDLEKAEALLKLAVDALAASPFHNGANDKGKKYLSWEGNLFRDQEQFERWLEEA